MENETKDLENWKGKNSGKKQTFWWVGDRGFFVDFLPLHWKKVEKLEAHRKENVLGKRTIISLIKQAYSCLIQFQIIYSCITVFKGHSRALVCELVVYLN